MTPELDPALQQYLDYLEQILGRDLLIQIGLYDQDTTSQTLTIQQITQVLSNRLNILLLEYLDEQEYKELFKLAQAQHLNLLDLYEQMLMSSPALHQKAVTLVEDFKSELLNKLS